MGELCDTCPKPMLPIDGKPKLAWSIEALPDEIDEVILIVGYLKEVVTSYFGEECAGRKIMYVEQNQLNGTGGAIHLAKNLVRGRFLVTMGDDLYLKEDLRKLLAHDLGVLAFGVEDGSKYGVLEADEKGNLERILEVPHTSESRLVNTGAYVISEDFFSYPLLLKAPGSSEYGLPQTMMQMKDKHRVAVVKARDWLPIGDKDALEEAKRRIQVFV